MREERFGIAQPIWNLQEMLRLVSFENPNIPRLVPDGVFGEETLEAVMVFQRDYGLPVTGVVDQESWDALVRQAGRVEQRLSPPIKVNGLPDRNGTVGIGERNQALYLVQAMFLALEELFVGVEKEPVSGVNTQGSVKNLRWLQQRAGFPENGILDQQTWDALARLYQLFVVRVGRNGMILRTSAQ